MSTRNSDINLVIRAKNEADRAINAVGDALKSLVGDAGTANSSTAEVAKNLAVLDKVAKTLSASQDKVSSSVSKQAAAVHAAAAGIAEQKGLVEELTRGLAQLQAQNDKAFVGPKSPELPALIKLTQQRLADAEKQVDRYTAAFERNLAGVRTARSGLLDLQRATRDTADTQAAVVAKIDAGTAAYERQTAAVRQRAAEEAKTTSLHAALGANGGPRTDGGAANNGATYSALGERDEEMERQAKAVLAAINPLAAIQDRYNASLIQYRGLAAAGKLTTDQLAAAEAHLATEATKAREALNHTDTKNKIGAFGLKPYELQNLGYQVNDVVTQLASGTSLSQTLAQQGGQILQLFPRVGGAIVGALSNPAILAFAATIGAIVITLKEAGDRAERLRSISASLKISADGGKYNAKDLSDQAEDLEDMGAKAKDATTALKTFIETGVAPDRLKQFGKAAVDASVALGIALPDAAKQMTDAFTGGYDAIANLDKKLNFLTGTEREHIRQLFESGDAEAARTEAVNAYSRVMDAAAKAQRGPWTEAWLSLKKTAGDAVKYLADTAPIKATIAVFNELASVVKYLSDGLDSLVGSDNAPKSNAEQISAKQEQIRTLTDDIAKLQAQAEKSPKIAGTFNHLIEGSKRQLADAQAQLAALEGKATDTTNDGPNSARAKERADTLSLIDLEAELQKLRDAGRRGLDGAESKRREQLAGQLAYNNSIKAQGDQIIAQRLREQAIAHETAEVQKENLAARNKAIKQFESQVIGAEGGAGKNPNSTAKGFGQFTEKTFLSVYSRTPGTDQSLGRDQILALRSNEQVARGVIDQYARENAKFLESFGAKVTAGNLYLAHFLGAGGAKAVLTAPTGTPVDQIIRGLPNAAQVLSGNQGYLRTEGGKGRYRTAGELRTFIGNRVGADSDVGAPQTEMQAALNTLLTEAKKRQDAINISVKQGNEDRDRTAAALKAEDGLYGTALLAEQKKQAVDAAELELRQKVEKQNEGLEAGDLRRVKITDAQIAATRAATAALIDQQHAREALTARLNDKQRPVDDLSGEKDLLESQAEFLKSIGDNNGVEQVQKQIAALTPQIQAAYDELIQFYKALSPEQRVDLGIVDEQQLQNIINKLKQAKQGSQEWGRVLGVSAKDIAQSLGSTAASAITSLIQKVASGKNVFASLGESVKEFAANFIQSIAQMIVQITAYAAAVGFLKLLGIPVPAVSVGSHHTGGIAGQATNNRNVSPAWFAGAMRYHTGGIAGLKPNEVPAILQRGEEVVTASDVRHRANGGGVGSGGSATNLKVVNAFSSSDLLSHALATREGQKVLINHVRSNSRAFKSAIAA